MRKLQIAIVVFCTLVADAKSDQPFPTTLTQHRITSYDGDTIVLRFDAPASIIKRYPGRSHSWGHAGCLMCLGNHLMWTHEQGLDYLRQNGWASWVAIHDNLHNDPSFEGEGGARRYVGHDIGDSPRESSVFAPTSLDVCEVMVDVAIAGSDDVLYDLGCGDGRLVIMAALKYNCQAIGLDIDPACVRQTNKNIKRYGVGHLAAAYERDVRKTDISDASVVTMYLMPSLTERLRPQLQALPAGTRIVAHDKPIPNWLPHGEIPVVSSADNHRHIIYLWRTIARQEQKAKPKCKT